MTRLEWSIAWRYLRSRRESALLSFISMIAIGGVIVGVSSLIIIIGVMNGLQTDLRDKILLGSPDVRVLGYGENVRLSNWKGALDTIRMYPEVRAASPFVMTDAMVLNSGNYAKGVRVQGIPREPAANELVTDIRTRAVEGDFRFATGDGTHHGAVLGKTLAATILARLGDTIRIVAPGGFQPAALFAGIIPPIHTFIVTGIFETEMYEYDATYIYVDLDVARSITGLGEDVSGIEVKTADRYRAGEVSAALDSILGFPRRLEDWTQANASLFRALKLEKLAMGVILLLVVIVAAFNIVSTLTMVVRAKTREIGILKAMGLKMRSVRNVFLLQGLVIGSVGTGIGLLIGVPLGIVMDRYRLIPIDASVYYLDHIPVRMEIGDTALIVIASVLIATLATLYPARHASRLVPVEAIRAE